MQLERSRPSSSRASSNRWESICQRLDVPFRRIGSLVVAKTDRDVKRLEEFHRNAENNGVHAEMVSGERARAMEPLLNPDCVAALSVPSEGIIDPMRLTISSAELAALNGADIRVRSPVIGFEHGRDGAFLVHTPTAAVRALGSSSTPPVCSPTRSLR